MEGSPRTLPEPDPHLSSQEGLKTKEHYAQKYKISMEKSHYETRTVDKRRVTEIS